MKPTKEQHVEICISILRRLASLHGCGWTDLENMGLVPDGGSCLLCQLYTDECRTTCPGQVVCTNWGCSRMVDSEGILERAFRYHAGRT